MFGRLPSSAREEVVSHHVGSPPSAGSSRGRDERICPVQSSPSNQGVTAPVGRNPIFVSPEGEKPLCWWHLMLLCAFLAISCGFIGCSILDLRPVDLRPGIGDENQAKARIKQGMTRDEV